MKPSSQAHCHAPAANAASRQSRRRQNASAAQGRVWVIQELRIQHLLIQTRPLQSNVLYHWFLSRALPPSVSHRSALSHSVFLSRCAFGFGHSNEWSAMASRAALLAIVRGYWHQVGAHEIRLEKHSVMGAAALYGASTARSMSATHCRAALLSRPLAQLLCVHLRISDWATVRDRFVQEHLWCTARVLLAHK